MTISLQSVVKKFPIKQSSEELKVLANISLDVSDGAIVSLFGPNGCGKTTILNVIAGIEIADSGIVLASGTDKTRPTVGYAFQNFRDVLLPWETAFDNV